MTGEPQAVRSPGRNQTPNHGSGSVSDLKQLATDIALLVSGFGFIAGMTLVVLMSLARCLWHFAEPVGYAAGGCVVGVPVWAGTMELRVWLMLT